MEEIQSESAKEIANVNKYPEVTEKVLQCYSSASTTASRYCLQSFCGFMVLRIYQTEYCKSTFLALLPPA